jgi:hypothetical protein
VLLDAFALKIAEVTDPNQKKRLRRASLMHSSNTSKWGNTVKVLQRMRDEKGLEQKVLGDRRTLIEI